VPEVHSSRLFGSDPSGYQAADAFEHTEQFYGRRGIGCLYRLTREFLPSLELPHHERHLGLNQR
jgi:hypothetical protein